jgi:hypothetical protein
LSDVFFENSLVATSELINYLQLSYNESADLQ